jgi:DNA-binding transcriptional MocR family regulator
MTSRITARPVISATRTASLVGDLGPGRPAYRALADALRLAVADGRIPLGTRMPSERDLTASLRVSRTTVARAYTVLRERGYLLSRRGSGSVAALPEPARRLRTGSLYPAEPRADVIDLTCAASRAPAGVAEAYEAAVSRLPAYLAGAGYLTLGVPELREAIAARYTERGVPTSPEEIVVTSGAVAGISIVAAALLRPGDRVLVESPAYPNTLGILDRARTALVTLPVTAAGWDVDTTIPALASARTRLALLVPDFHNPTGALMPDDVRTRLGRALRSAGTTPVVDETIAEIVLDAPAPLPLPFAAHHPGTISVGSAAKSHWGGLRTGWIRLPRKMIRTIVEARMTVDPGAAVLEQLVLTDLLRTGAGLAPDRRHGLVAARDALAAALHTHLPDVRFAIPSGGMSLWCELPQGLDATAVALAAESAGLLLAPGPRFAPVGGLGRWLRVPFVQPPEVMTEAVGRLTRAVARARADARSAPDTTSRAARSRRRHQPILT